MNPQSDHFTLTFEGIRKVGKAGCYVVKIANNINSDLSISWQITVQRIFPFYILKTILIFDVDFSSFLSVLAGICVIL
jgi:hypothetical protein